MCKCKNVKMGDHHNEIVLYVPYSVVLRTNNPEREIRSSVSIDSCLKDEIENLWELGIATTGCCCGHNIAKPYIGVEYRFIPQMVHMGYEKHIFEKDTDRRDTFNPKTIFCPYCDENISPSNLLELLIGEHDGNLYIHPVEVDHPDRDLGIFSSDGKFRPVD